MGFFHTMQKRKGFTIIEVTIVLAVIALLASVVLANMSESKKKARDMQRISDLQQLSVAFRVIADINSGYPNYSGEVIGDGLGLEASSAISYSDYVPATLKDPLHDGTTYKYVYDNSFPCGGTHVVLYVPKMEQSSNRNFATVCGSSPPGSPDYIVILK